MQVQRPWKWIWTNNRYHFSMHLYHKNKYTYYPKKKKKLHIKEWTTCKLVLGNTYKFPFNGFRQIFKFSNEHYSHQQGRTPHSLTLSTLPFYGRQHEQTKMQTTMAPLTFQTHTWVLAHSIWTSFSICLTLQLQTCFQRHQK